MCFEVVLYFVIGFILCLFVPLVDKYTNLCFDVPPTMMLLILAWPIALPIFWISCLD
jgi:hypothetical protein